MADETYYAWSPIHHSDGVVKVGSKVTAEKVGVSDEEFQSYIDGGVVRTIPYPDMGNFPGSPVEFSKAQLAAAAEGGYFDSQYGRVAAEDANEEEVAEVENEGRTARFGLGR